MQTKQVIGYNLSPVQRRLWSLESSSQHSPYGAVGAWRIEGSLDLQVFEAAMESVVARNEILRTTFQALPGMGSSLQIIKESSKILIEKKDFQDLSPSERGDALKAVFQEEVLKPFDYTARSLLRVSLATLSPGDAVLYLALPALCADSTTLTNLVCEIGRSYAALVAGEKLLDQPLQFPDLAAWQNEIFDSGDPAGGEEGSRKRISYPTAPARLPNELAPAPERSEFVPRTVQFLIDRELWDGVREVSEARSCSSSTVVLAAWQALLHRLTGCSTLTLGIAFNGRYLEELKTALGPLTKFLPVTAAFHAGDAFANVIDATRESVTAVELWQEAYGWDEPGQESESDEKESYFPYCFEYETDRSAHAGPILLHPLQRKVCVDRFDLKLTCAEQGGILNASLDYDARRITEEQVTRIADCYDAFLAAVVKDCDRRIGAIDILSPRERERLLEIFNATAAELPSNICIHHLIEEQVARTPAAKAARFGEHAITYAELDAEADLLAARLQDLGVGPETLLAIFMDRSIEMVVGALGALKSGGAYLPIDVSYPRERIAFILSDSGAEFVLTLQRFAENVPSHSAKILCVDTFRRESVSASRRKPNACVTPDQLAYVIYTSGSTGKPKGTMITHQGVVNYLSWCKKIYPTSSGIGSPVMSPLGFDLTVTSLFTPLVSGKTVSLLPEGQDSQDMSQSLTDEGGYSLIKITPAHLDALGAWISPEALPALTSSLVIGGEALYAESIARWRAWAPSIRFFNEYGPTETVVGCCVYEVPRVGSESGPIPIGKPIDNTRLYVLNEELQPVPAGLSGELFIGGAGVARGYVGLPDLTAERFAPDPFGSAPGARLYRTGDQVRFLADGNIEYVGRLDHQIKLRGYRIELGEIESALLRHPEIREAAVVIHTMAPGDKRLTAYVVARPTSQPSGRDLSAFLKEHLPDYMIPATFINLDALPLTSNGKVDRAALPKPDQAGTGSEQSAPRTPTEELLVSVWSEVLGRDQVGIHDNFFELGGHSLIATQVVSRVRRELGVDLLLRSLFEAPTVASLAECVDTLRQSGSGVEPIPPIERVPRDGYLPPSFSQQRLWFLDQLVPSAFIYNAPIAVRLIGKLNAPAFRASLNELARRHEALRTTFDVVHNRPVQVIAPVLKLALPMIDLFDVEEEKKEALALKVILDEIERPFDLRYGPVVRISLLRLRQEEHIVLYTVHHIVSDDWSIGVIIREISQLYSAFVHNRPSPLPELTIQYADYSNWQRRWVQGGVLAKQVAYWKRQLAGAQVQMELPTDFPRPKGDIIRGAKEDLALAPALANELLALSRKEGATLYMTLLTGFSALIYCYSGLRDILIGCPIAGRTRPEIEDLVGFFVNILLMRPKIEGDPTFRELLAQVREVTLGAYMHQDLPFELLPRLIASERDPGRASTYLLGFNLRNAPMPGLGLEGLAADLVNIEPGRAAIDLSLTMTHTRFGLLGSIRYKPDLYRQSTISRLCSNLETLLQKVVENPDVRVDELRDLLGESDRIRKMEEQQSLANTGLQQLRSISRRSVTVV